MMQNRVGVMGWPLCHTLSPVMHNAAFRALGMDTWHYQSIPVPPDDLENQLRKIADQGYIGVNVTTPYKQAILPWVKADGEGRKIGAVNTIVFHDFSATNTDWIGFIEDLHAHDLHLAGAKVAVLGAGGAARAVVYGLIQEGSQVIVVNRSLARAYQMVEDLRAKAEVLPIEEVPVEQLALIVNCTSLGMWPKIDECPWPETIPIPSQAIIYDLVYSPSPTRFLHKAKMQKCQTIGGLGMLVRQGAASFSRWTGKEAPYQVMLAAVKAALEKIR